MGTGFAPTWLRQVSPTASQNHFNHCLAPGLPTAKSGRAYAYVDSCSVVYIHASYWYCFSNLNLICPSKSSCWLFWYLCTTVVTTSSTVTDSSWQWMHHRTLYDKLWGPAFSCYNLMSFRRNSQFLGQINFNPPWKKMARTPMPAGVTCREKNSTAYLHPRLCNKHWHFSVEGTAVLPWTAAED